jgi:poly(3-hydroxybutyrate) depolymerase
MSLTRLAIVAAVGLVMTASSTAAYPTVTCGSYTDATGCNCSTLLNAEHEWDAVIDVTGSMDLCDATRKLYVSSNGTSTETSLKPALIVLHGGGSPDEVSAAGMAEVMQFASYADAAGIVIAYGQSTTIVELNSEGGTQTSWNVGACTSSTYPGICGEGDESTIDDVAYVSAAIDVLVSGFNVDPDNVFVFGWSKGGAMAYRLSCELGSKIKGVVPYNGMMGWKDGQECEGTGRVASYLSAVGLTEYDWDQATCSYSSWSQSSSLSPYYTCTDTVQNMMIVKGAQDLICPSEGCVDATRSVPPNDFLSTFFREGMNCDGSSSVSFYNSTGSNASASIFNTTLYLETGSATEAIVTITAPDDTTCTTWSGCTGNFTECILSASGHFPAGQPATHYETYYGPYAESFALSEATLGFIKSVSSNVVQILTDEDAWTEA